jgi:hypothetical protein
METKTNTQTNNLLYLAGILDSTPKVAFDMSSTFRVKGVSYDNVTVHQLERLDFSNAICSSLGWAIVSPKLKPDKKELFGGLNSETLSRYRFAKDAFGVNKAEFHYLFWAGWSEVNNYPYFHAQRIRCFVEYGLPENWRELAFGDHTIPHPYQHGYPTTFKS